VSGGDYALAQLLRLDDFELRPERERELLRLDRGIEAQGYAKALGDWSLLDDSPAAIRDPRHDGRRHEKSRVVTR
jgi:hypothetical protein